MYRDIGRKLLRKFMEFFVVKYPPSTGDLLFFILLFKLKSLLELVINQF